MAISIRTRPNPTRMAYNHQQSLPSIINSSLHSNGNIIQTYPAELPPMAVLPENVRTAIDEYRPIHRNYWPLSQRYSNYRDFTEYQAREFILGRIAGDGYSSPTQLHHVDNRISTFSDRTNVKSK